MTHIEQLLITAIAEVTGLDAAGLRPETRLDDIGVDSLASAEVLVDVEIGLGRQLPAGTLRKLDATQTIADVAALLDAAFAAPPGPAP